MRVTKSFLSLPPFLSTSWEHVTSIRLESDQSSGAPVLVVHLADGTRTDIPHLSDTMIEAVFAAHEKYLEEGGSQPAGAPPEMGGLFSDQMMTFPLKFGEGGTLDSISTAMQHNPEQASMPNLPPELLDKVASVARALGADEAFEPGQAVPHCNCFYCQLSRAVGGQEPRAEESALVEEEEVSDDDLRFRTWDIEEAGEQLYTVINPLDPTERYSVYLGTPIGCTCGEENCEHIRAVLSS